MICVIPNSFGARLLERDGSFKYASTQIDLPPHLAKKHQQMAAQIPDQHLADHGRENDPHVTVKYGLDPAHLDRAAAVVRQHPPITARFGRTSAFTGGEDGDVVKVDVHSKALHALHHAIKKAVPNVEKYPAYQPHMTVAYVKPGQAAQYAGKNPMTGQSHTFTHVTLSDTQGNKRKVRLGG